MAAMAIACEAAARALWSRRWLSCLWQAWGRTSECHPWSQVQAQLRIRRRKELATTKTAKTNPKNRRQPSWRFFLLALMAVVRAGGVVVEVGWGWVSW